MKSITLSLALLLAQPALHFAAQHGAAVDVPAAAYSYSFPEKPAHAVHIQLKDPQAAAKVRELFRANLGERVQVQIGSRLESLPIVRDAPTGDAWEWTTATDGDYSALKAAFGTGK